jgi:hypothetical protein
MAASLAWGGMRNGYIPASALRSIGRGFLLEATAAAQFLAARAFLLTVHGIDILDYVSETYRDWDGQVYQKRRWTLLGKPGNAATPGDSIHGWAKAADFDADALERDGIYGLVMATLARYGFIRDFLDLGETWHVSFREASIIITASFTPFEEDDMYDNNDRIRDDNTAKLLVGLRSLVVDPTEQGVGSTVTLVQKMSTDVDEIKGNTQKVAEYVVAPPTPGDVSMVSRVIAIERTVAGLDEKLTKILDALGQK